MTREIQSFFALNRGVVSRLGLARADVKRLAIAAQVQTNWMCRVLGSMSLRVGWQYLVSTSGNAAARYLKFIFSTNDTALIELTANNMRVLINDVVLSRVANASAIVNGTFATNLTGWTQLDDAGAVSSWVAPNYMQLVGTGTARAIREQQVFTASANIEHAMRIVVVRGPVSLRVGTLFGLDDSFVRETVLNTGIHSIAFTPTGNFAVRFFSTNQRVSWVSNCTLEAPGEVDIPTPWGASDLNNIRYDQSADVIFVACAGYQQRRIERRGVHPGGKSWSVALYPPNDGPFQLQNVSPITLNPSDIVGNITLTASLPMFRATHVGSLFSLTSIGQEVRATSSSSGVATGSIRIVGIGGPRTMAISIAGNATGSTVNLQRSYDNATWSDVASQTWTANVTTTYLDGLDNQIVYYRMKLVTRVAPDSVTMDLANGSGSIRGVVRVTDYTSNTVVGAEVVVALGGTGATSNWQEAQWSDKKGWPTSVRFHEGRLWWAGQNGIWGSVSDAYDSFDETFVGDAGPINRTVGAGPVDTINWMVSLKGLMMGAQGAEYSVRASSLDEPLTPNNFNLKVPSTQGSGPVDSIKVDQFGYFVNRSSVKVFELAFDLKAYDYNSTDLMALAPELGLPGIVRMDLQRMPDTRLHCVRSDGTVIVAVMNKNEDMLAWIPVTTSGFVEDVVVLPAISGNLDDQVYYVVRRTINGAIVRYLEKWAQEIDCRGDKQLCKLADAHITYTGAPTTVITGLSHLEGQQVVVWADGADVGTNDAVVPWVQRYTVAGGQITLAVVASNVVVGLGYTSQFQSSKLGSMSQGLTPLNQQKKINHVGLILADTHPRGVQFGPSFDALDDMPLIEDGTLIGTATESDYDQNFIEFPGTWTTDARICLQGQAPRPCTVMAVTMDMERFS